MDRRAEKLRLEAASTPKPTDDPLVRFVQLVEAYDAAARMAGASQYPKVRERLAALRDWLEDEIYELAGALTSDLTSPVEGHA